MSVLIYILQQKLTNSPYKFCSSHQRESLNSVLPTAGAFKGALDFSFTLEVLFQLPLVLRVTLRQRF